MSVSPHHSHIGIPTNRVRCAHVTSTETHAKTHARMKGTPKNPTLTCPVRTQWRGISLAQGALSPQVPILFFRGIRRTEREEGPESLLMQVGDRTQGSKGMDAALSGCLLFLRAPPLLWQPWLSLQPYGIHICQAPTATKAVVYVVQIPIRSLTFSLASILLSTSISKLTFFLTHKAGCPLSLWLCAVCITRKQAGCSSVLYLVPSSSCSLALFWLFRRETKDLNLLSVNPALAV